MRKLFTILCASVVSALALTTVVSANDGTADAGCPSGPSLHLLETQAKAGDLDAMAYLGEALMHPDCAQEARDKGLRMLVNAAEAGQPQAMFLIGIMVVARHSEPEGSELGSDYIRRSAEAGHVEAEAWHGAMLMAEARGEAERDDAFYWLGSAASKGSVRAAMTVHHVYRAGMHGVQRDDCLAALWFDVAVMLQHPNVAQTADADVTCN
ncbi:MAG: hypothetical protein AAGA05_05375 [Pseudomonadota bacterium]